MVLIKSVFVFLFLITCVSTLNNTSPCPRLFVYEQNTSTSLSNRWYGTVTLLSGSELEGVWLVLIFDRELQQIGVNWFGDVEADQENTKFLIKNQNYKLKANTPYPIRFSAQYDENRPVPKLVSIKLNGRKVCPEENLNTRTTVTSHSQSSEQMTIRTSTVKPFNIDEPPLFISFHKTPQIRDNVCGTVSVQLAKPQTQIAQIGQYPWHAALYYTKDISIAYLCGASLISDNHLITVAHCVIKGSTQTVVNPDRLVAYLGKYYLKYWTQEGTHTRYISKIVTHPDYKPETNTNDIAILRMTNPIEVTDFVRPVCLWKDDVSTNVGSVVGWGFDPKRQIEEKLMHVEMAIQTDDICNVSVANYSVKFNNDMTYCASFVEDTLECVADSGGGMVFLTDAGTWQLRGIVTISVVLQHQLKCGPQQYVVFTDVSKYENWIKETLITTDSVKF